MHLARPVEHVALDPDPGQPCARGGEMRQRATDPAAPDADIVAIHRRRQDAVRPRIEAIDQLPPW